MAVGLAAAVLFCAAAKAHPEAGAAAVSAPAPSLTAAEAWLAAAGEAAGYASIAFILAVGFVFFLFRTRNGRALFFDREHLDLISAAKNDYADPEVSERRKSAIILAVAEFNAKKAIAAALVMLAIVLAAG